MDIETYSSLLALTTFLRRRTAGLISDWVVL